MWIAMRLINRPFYMSKLSKVAGTPDIKVITGIRRCGKSKLLEAFASQLHANDPAAYVIHGNFNLLECEPLAEYHALHTYVE